MTFAPPEWRPIRLVAVEGAEPKGRERDWLDDLAAAVADAEDIALERLGPAATLNRLEASCLRIDPDPDRIDVLVVPSAPGGRGTAKFVAAVRERAPDVPVIVHPETGSVEEAADATAAGADRYLVRSGTEAAETDGESTLLLTAVRELAADHDDVRTDRLASQLLRAMLDDLQQIVYFKDADGRHVCVSAQVAAANDESVVGKTDLDLYEAQTGDPARRAYEDDLTVAREGERIVDKEERFATDHGEANWLRTTKVPWTAPDGTPRGLIGFTEAINEQKAREAELQRERQRLEAFASFVSHDLRNPVAIASGYLDLARENGDPEALAKVEGAVERMDDLIDDVLALVEPGSPDDSLAWHSLRGAVEDAWDRVDAADASLTLAVPEDVEVLAEAGLLGLLLENLLSNAVEHGSTSPDSDTREDSIEHAGDGVAIEVGCTAEGFYVADDGPGIDAEDPGRVFEYGYTEGGTGLGLAIVTEVAAFHRWVPTVDDWASDRSTAGGAESLPSGAGEDVGAPDDPPAARGYDGACFRIRRCVLRTAAHREATPGDAIEPTESTDVGEPAIAGTTSRVEAGTDDGTPVGPVAWRVEGVGKNIWRDVEEFHLAYATVPGDVRLVARLADFQFASEYAKAGVVLARGPVADEPLSFLGSVGVHGCESIHRSTPGAMLSIRNHSDRTAVPIWLRLDRVGDRVTCYVSADGTEWTPVDQHVLALDDEPAVAGLSVCSHDERRRSTAVFDHVRIAPLGRPRE